MLLPGVLQKRILPFILKDCQILFARYFYSTPLKEILVNREGLTGNSLRMLGLGNAAALANGKTPSIFVKWAKLKCCTSSADAESHHWAPRAGLLSCLGESRKKYNELCIPLF